MLWNYFQEYLFYHLKDRGVRGRIRSFGNFLRAPGTIAPEVYCRVENYCFVLLLQTMCCQDARQPSSEFPQQRHMTAHIETSPSKNFRTLLNQMLLNWDFPSKDGMILIAIPADAAQLETQ